MPDDRLRRKNLGRSLDLDQHDHGGRDRDGRCRVHYDAQRAMVCIALKLVQVGHLGDGQQGQESKAHQSGCRKSAWLRAAFLVEMYLKSCQVTFPALRIHSIRRMRLTRGSMPGPLLPTPPRQRECARFV